MKNICKKLSIIFVMVLGIMGVGAISNGYVANAATVGEQLLQPEEGWKRGNIDNNNNFKYDGYWRAYDNSSGYFNHDRYELTGRGSVKVNFTGDKVRVILASFWSNASKFKVYIDGNLIDEVNSRILGNKDWLNSQLGFEKTNLNNGEHYLEIKVEEDGYYLELDALDIDKNAKLLPYDEEIENKSIALDKSLLTLQEGTSKDLIATTTPESANVVWSSSDESIATVDQDGKVIGVSVGTCIITATIEGTDIKDTCEVTVTKEDVQEPEEPTGDGNLYIEMVDGNIKQAQELDVDSFIKWFKNRDLDDAENPIYKIKNSKGNTEYLMHDKIVAFEVR